MFVSKVVVGKIVNIELSPAVGLVVDALAAFFLYGIALVVEIGLGDVQRLHAVRFEKEAQLQLIFGQLFEVSGAVFVGGAVHPAAIVQHLDEVLALADVGRTLEHHVLEKVGETGAAGSLIAAADVVGDINRIYRRGVVGHQNYAQAVIELGVAQFELRQFQIVIARRSVQGRYEPTGYHDS